MKTSLNNIISINNIIKIYENNKIIQNDLEVILDSRNVEKDSLFIPLKGEKHDAHKFLKDVIKKKVKYLVVEQTFYSANESLFKNVESNIIIVDSSIKYFHNLARKHFDSWRNCLNPNRENKNLRKVICITGSNGKTTLKEMLFHLLNKVLKNKIHYTKGNFNNHIGLPITMLSVQKDHCIAILEIGTNNFGEIEMLADLAKPDYGVITNIGSTHLEFLKNKEGVFKEKSSLYNYFENNVNNVDRFLINMNDVYLKNLKKDNEFELLFDYEIDSLEIKGIDVTNIFGEHNKINMSMAYKLSLEIFPEKKLNFVEAIKNFNFKFNRSSWIIQENRSIFLDAYNANPTSVNLSINEFIKFVKEKNINLSKVIIILGDMNELGEETRSYHISIGEKLSKIEKIKIAFIGKYAKYYQEGHKGGNVLCDTAREFKDKHWDSIKNTYEYYFIKGSRSVMLEQLIDE
jgi:UDP-N-acetylmuramoyl-tripeptide--D-alanyl-D-alanine ligase